MRFAVLGEAVIDLVERPDGAFAAHPGGSPLNVAVALSRLRRPVELLARFSTGLFGRRLRAHAEGNGVGLRHAVTAREPATLAAVAIDPSGSAAYDFYVDGTADWQWTAEDLAALPAFDVLHTGSLACARPPGGERILTLLRRLRAEGGTLVSYDPNVRPGLTDDLCALRRRVEAFAAVADVVKSSDEDLALLYPGRAAEDVVAEWRSLGAGLVVVTRGADGAFATTADGVYDSPGERVPVVDTIGAGDAFMAALLAAHGTMPIPEALRLAGRVAALTCTRPGADPPTLAEVEAAYPAPSPS
ncbi:carbohydrate kinase family protein [Dactylosporangium sp. McL0621]|uniref:carbohydrate kinase family protein n=1 Tax=Dactylosporangium sp. McL0621 TaxID=3415678 RepID=UPI003CE81CD9